MTLFPQPTAAAVLWLATANALSAQAAGDIGLQGTAAYALIRTTPAAATDLPGTPLNSRFNGRIGIRMARQLFVGVNVGSLMYTTEFGSYNPGFGQLVGAVASAVFASSYLQLYPLRSFPIFARGGIGYAATATYVPTPLLMLPAPLIEEHHTRLSTTLGLGLDIPVRRHFAVTLSADYLKLFGATGKYEPAEALLAGFGLTVH